MPKRAPFQVLAMLAAAALLLSACGDCPDTSSVVATPPPRFDQVRMIDSVDPSQVFLPDSGIGSFWLGLPNPAAGPSWLVAFQLNLLQAKGGMQLELTCGAIRPEDLLKQQTLPITSLCGCPPQDADCEHNGTSFILILGDGVSSGLSYRLADTTGTVAIVPSGEPVYNGSVELTFNIPEMAALPVQNGDKQTLTIQNLVAKRTITTTSEPDSCAGSGITYTGWHPGGD